MVVIGVFGAFLGILPIPQSLGRDDGPRLQDPSPVSLRYAPLIVLHASFFRLATRPHKNNWLPRFALQQKRLILLSNAAPGNLSQPSRDRLHPGFFDASNFFRIRIAWRPQDEFLAGSHRPAIKNDINFFLDFDFQPLYTFINCGFLLRTAHP